MALLLLVAILAVLASVKLPHAAATNNPHVDGGYYLEVAKHVRDGEGLVTNISLRNKGYPYFPFPTTVYPLWPLVLGYLAKVFPLYDAGRWGATVCYFLTLVFGYLWANRLFTSPLFGRWLPWLNAGHVFVFLFGTNRNLFIKTSTPDTEGISYALLMIALWRAAKVVPRATLRGGIELGAWCALLMLARSQLLLMTMGVVSGLVLSMLLVRSARLDYAKMLGGCIAGCCLVMAPHVLRVMAYVPNFKLSYVLRWDEIYYNNYLTHPHAFRPTGNLTAYLAHTLRGFKVAFGWNGGSSYAKQYFTAQYAVLLAFPFASYYALKALWSKSWGRTVAWVRRQENQGWVFTVVFAFGAFVSMHVLHRYAGWYFHRRHTLTSFFFIFLCLVFLFRRGAFGRIVGTLVLGSSLWFGVGWLRDVAANNRSRAHGAERADLIRWLQARAKTDPDMLIVAMRQPGRQAFRTDGIGYHHYDGRVTLRDVEAMVTRLGVDYVLVPTSERIRFVRSPAFRQHFRHVGTRSAQRIYEPNAALLKKRQARGRVQPG